MADDEYKTKPAHPVEAFQVGHSEDGAFMSLTFDLPSGETMTIAVPFNVQFKFVEDVAREYKECERRQRWRNDYAEPSGD